MPAVTYYVAIPFSRDDEGNLLPGDPKECPNGDRARRMAQSMADKHAGAIAFSRSGDLDQGDFLAPAATMSMSHANTKLIVKRNRIAAALQET